MKYVPLKLFKTRFMYIIYGLLIYSVIAFVLLLLWRTGVPEKLIPAWLYTILWGGLDIFVSGYLLIMMFQPLKSIFIDRYCVFNEDEGVLFRYWCTINPNEYLYNAVIRVRLFDEENENYVEGVNERYSLWDSNKSKNKDIYCLDKIRGERIIRITDESFIKAIENMARTLSEKQYIELSISADTALGEKVSCTQVYYLSDNKKTAEALPLVLSGYMFAPTSQNSFTYVKYKKEISESKSPIVRKLYEYLNEDKNGFVFYNSENARFYYKLDDTKNNIFINNKPTEKKIVNYVDVVLGKEYKYHPIINTLAFWVKRIGPELGNNNPNAKRVSRICRSAKRIKDSHNELKKHIYSDVK